MQGIYLLYSCYSCYNILWAPHSAAVDSGRYDQDLLMGSESEEEDLGPEDGEGDDEEEDYYANL